MMNEQHFYKEIEAHFCLRTNKTKKPEMIYLVARIDGKQYKLSCGVKVYPNHWHRGIAEESNLLSKRDNANNKIANEKLTVILDDFSKFKHYLCSCDTTITDMGVLLKSYIYKRNIVMINEVKNKEKSVVTLIKEAFEEQYEVNKPNVTEDSMKQARSGLNLYVDFLKGLSKEEQEIAFTRTGFLLWRKYIVNRVNDPNVSYGAKTANTHGGLIKSLINDVLYNKSNLKNVESVTWTPIKDTRKQQEIGHFELLPEELDKVKAIVFDEKKKDGAIMREEVKNGQYRDLFILHTLCGLRVSDLKKLIDGDYKVGEENGQQYYLVETEKNGNTAYVMQTKELDKYLKIVRSSELKTFKNQYYNDRVKTICKRAGLNRIIERKDTQGRNTNNPLYEVVTSHCARYTFIRTKYHEGYTEMEVGKMVGHKDDTMVKKVYNKKTDEDFMHQISNGKARVEGKKATGLAKESIVTNKQQKKTTVINAFFAYDDIVALMDMKESGISIYDDLSLDRARCIIKKSVNKATLDKAIKMLQDADKDAVRHFKEQVASINSFVWEIGKHFADPKLYMMYQYKQNKLGILDKKPLDEETLDSLWQQELVNSEELL